MSFERPPISEESIKETADTVGSPVQHAPTKGHFEDQLPDPSKGLTIDQEADYIARRLGHNDPDKVKEFLRGDD